jgi:hypothetical protein
MFQFGKVVRVGYFLKRKKSLFFKFFIDFLKHKYLVVKRKFVLGLLFSYLEKVS